MSKDYKKRYFLELERWDFPGVAKEKVHARQQIILEDGKVVLHTQFNCGEQTFVIHKAFKPSKKKALDDHLGVVKKWTIPDKEMQEIANAAVQYAYIKAKPGEDNILSGLLIKSALSDYASQYQELSECNLPTRSKNSSLLSNTALLHVFREEANHTKTKLFAIDNVERRIEKAYNSLENMEEDVREKLGGDESETSEALNERIDKFYQVTDAVRVALACANEKWLHAATRIADGGGLKQSYAVQFKDEIIYLNQDAKQQFEKWKAESEKLIDEHIIEGGEKLQLQEAAQWAQESLFGDGERKGIFQQIDVAANLLGNAKRCETEISKVLPSGPEL